MNYKKNETLECILSVKDKDGGYYFKSGNLYKLDDIEPTHSGEMRYRITGECMHEYGLRIHHMKKYFKQLYNADVRFDHAMGIV